MQACEALAVAHANGIVHRDIKPENLFLTQRAQGMDIIKVLDFGISKVALTGSLFEINVPLVRTQMPMGSPVYMSPEQIRATADVDARTDIWSLGCVLFELITGNAAFDAPSLTQLSAVILEKDPPLLRSLCPNAPIDLERVITRCLQKNPAKRFQNVGELALALFPFAPRRARISAERCCYVLKAAGMMDHAYEIPSIHPPSVSGTAESMAVSATDAHAGHATGIGDDDSPSSGRVTSPRSKWGLFAIALGALLVVGAYVSWTKRAAILGQPGWGPEPVASVKVIAPAPTPIIPTTPAAVDTPQAYEVPGAPAAKTQPSTTAAAKGKPLPPPPPAVKPKPAPAAKPAANDTSANHEPDPGF
jgi:serine/threonine-protein kinase